MKLLLGYDGSECADLALADLKKAGLPDSLEAIVLSVAEAWELPLVVDRVSTGSKRFVHPNVVAIEKHLAEVTGHAQDLADGAARQLKQSFPGWSVTTEAVSGNPAVTLITKADGWSPDLLVVGSQGRSTLGRLLLGSVSHKVLHEARCPVRISRRNTYGNNANVRILIAVDGSSDAARVVTTVAERIWPEDTEIRLIAVDDPFSHPKAGYVSWNTAEQKLEESEASQEWIKKVIEAPAEILRSAGLRVSHNIRWGDAAKMILDEAKDWQADTIFLGARGLGRIKRFLLGSVSSSVAARAGCSVEILRTDVELRG
ncbi:MAG TPA: universal stress protein [Pyrinomonadaceae bacterium]